MINAVGPLGRARGRRNQGKEDEARGNLKRRLDDELNRIKRVLVSYLYSDISERYVADFFSVQSIPNAVQSKPMSFNTVYIQSGKT